MSNIITKGRRVYSDKIAGNLALVPQNLRLESIKSISWVDESFIIDKPLVQIINKIKML